MTAGPDMALVDLWSRIDLEGPGVEEGVNPLDHATIDGRPLTADERHRAGQARWAELEAAHTLKAARIAAMDLLIESQQQLLDLLSPWWKGRTLEQALKVAPPLVAAEALELLAVIAACEEGMG